MNRLQQGFTAAALAAVVATLGISPGNAAPAFVPMGVSGQSDVIQVRDSVRWRGYRGYRNYRPGHHYNDGWWFPAGAFIAGALIGGAVVNSNSYYGGYYGDRYDGERYYVDDYAPRYQVRPRAYYPSRSAYESGYRDGYRDGYSRRSYGDITCTHRLQEAGRC